jgi:hypothetical protein
MQGGVSASEGAKKWDVGEPADSDTLRLLQQNNQHPAVSLQDLTQQSPPIQELRLPFRHDDWEWRQFANRRPNHP